MSLVTLQSAFLEIIRRKNELRENTLQNSRTYQFEEVDEETMNDIDSMIDYTANAVEDLKNRKTVRWAENLEEIRYFSNNAKDDLDDDLYKDEGRVLPDTSVPARVTKVNFKDDDLYQTEEYLTSAERSTLSEFPLPPDSQHIDIDTPHPNATEEVDFDPPFPPLPNVSPEEGCGSSTPQERSPTREERRAIRIGKLVGLLEQLERARQPRVYDAAFRTGAVAVAIREPRRNRFDRGN
jgi:hypothetical protein